MLRRRLTGAIASTAALAKPGRFTGSPVLDANSTWKERVPSQPVLAGEWGPWA